MLYLVFSSKMDTNQLIETFEAAIALIFLIRIKVLLKQRANLRNRRPLGRLLWAILNVKLFI
jgi:hypothetical protein